MTDTIELIDKAEVRDGQAIVKYSRTEHALAILREKYKDAKYDLTTTAGDKAARAAGPGPDHWPGQRGAHANEAASRHHHPAEPQAGRDPARPGRLFQRKGRVAK